MHMEGVWQWHGRLAERCGVNRCGRIVPVPWPGHPGGVKNFRRKLCFADGFPGLTGGYWEHRLFGEISSRQAANPLAGIRTPA
jgi:hypothetical protein